MNNPEKFFLDSRNPISNAIGHRLVRTREEDQERALPVLAPLHACPEQMGRGISVIVPIHNAPGHLEKCVQSLLRHTSRPCRLLLIDDASTDPRIDELLVSVQAQANIAVIRNETNLGYTATINRGIIQAGRDDVVLLNSDTQVGPHWLQNLFVAAYQAEDIASVTPLSNNGGAFSAPDCNCCNELPRDCASEDLCRAIFQADPKMFGQAPTGNGFCLYLRRDALDWVGLFDAEAFPRGYCEENDWCQRAIQAGWRHVIDGRTYVLHHQAGSFGPERSKLIRANRNILDRRFPAYTRAVRDFLDCSDMEQIREKVQSAFISISENGKHIRPRILFVISSETGGTPQTNNDLMQGLRQEYAPFLLICNSRTVQLRDCSGESPVLLEKIKLQTPIQAPEHTSLEYDRLIGSWLISYAIELVHIRHLSWHSLSLPKVANNLGIPVVLSLHDFYTVCPSTQLLDENGIHCQGRCTDTPGDCEAPLWGREEKPGLKHAWVFTWRGKMREVFEFCDAFVTTCQTAKDLAAGIYPLLGEKPFPIIPHGRDFASFFQPDWLFEQEEKIRLLFPGNLNRAKGMDLVVQLKELDADDRLEIHLLGKVATAYQDNLKGLVFHGPYKREEFQKKIKQIGPHCIGLFSLWPETYSHTLTEAWAAGVPVLVTPFGALQERVTQWGGGWILPSINAEEVYACLLSCLQDRTQFEEKLRQVRTWQKHSQTQQTVATMAAEYKAVYENVRNSKHEIRNKFVYQKITILNEEG